MYDKIRYKLKKIINKNKTEKKYIYLLIYMHKIFLFVFLSVSC